MRRLALENCPSDGKTGYVTWNSLKSYWCQDCLLFDQDFYCSYIGLFLKTVEKKSLLGVELTPYWYIICTMVHWCSWHGLI